MPAAESAAPAAAPSPADACTAAALAAASALGAAAPLDRERAARALPAAMAAVDPSTLPSVLDAIESAAAAAATAGAWHARLGGLAASLAVLKARGEPSPSVVSRAVAALDDAEPRVRLAACDLLGAAAAARAGGGGLAVWEAAAPTIFRLIARDWDRDRGGGEDGGEEGGEGDDGPALPPTTGALPQRARPLDVVAAPAGDDDPTAAIRATLASSYAPQPPGAGEMRHGTEGWRALETAVRAVLAIIDGCGPAFAPVAAEPGGTVVGLVTRAVLHPNRFVREAAYGALGGLAALLAPHADEHTDAGARAAAFVRGAAARLGEEGLAENWSQVRLAACVAARALLRACPRPPSPARAAALASLLPALALNRYDAAEGVAAYSQATWGVVTEGKGAAAVAAAAPAVVAHYLRSARTNNHQVREAAATCMGELAAKVDADAVRPHAAALVKALLAAAKDDAWPVRDAAGRALAQVAAAFPGAVAPASARAAWAAWAGALDDNVPSVRGGAGAALVSGALAFDGAGIGLPDGGLPAVSAAGGGGKKGAASPPPPPPADHPAIAAAGGHGTYLGAVAALAIAALARVADQAPGGPAHPPPRGLAPPLPPGAPAGAPPDLFKGGAGAGLLRPRRDTGGIDFSCGCMDYSYKRAREAWEAADGGARLVAALAEEGGGGGGSGGSGSSGAAPASGRGAPTPTPPPATAAALALLPALAAAAAARHYTACWSLRETAAHTVVTVLAAAGPRAVKPHLDALLPPLLECLGPAAADRPLARAAAGRAVAALRDAVGPRIFAGRLDDGARALVEASPDVPPPAGRFVPGGGGGSGGGSGAVGPGHPTRAPWAGGAPVPVAAPAPGPGLRPEGYAPGGFPLRGT